jgi:staphyloferrin B biosynthesis citrate synthase
MHLQQSAAFRRRLRMREHLIGTFVKMPCTHPIEILGSLGFDFVIIDQEHAPLDLAQIDLLILAARAANIAVIVRLAEATPASILSVLDCGATGIMVPHVDTPERAAEIAQACRYRGGRRGFANTTRAGRFGDVPYADHMTAQDEQVACIAMIEDLAALERLDAIAAVPGIDAFFVGRGDLTAALGLSDQTAPQTREAVERIAAAARRADIPVVVLPSNRADAADMQGLGASAFVLGNDQSMLKRAAREAMREFAAPLTA